MNTHSDNNNNTVNKDATCHLNIILPLSLI